MTERPHLPSLRQILCKKFDSIKKILKVFPKNATVADTDFVWEIEIKEIILAQSIKMSQDS